MIPNTMLSAFVDESEKIAASRVDKGLLAVLMATTLASGTMLAKDKASRSARPAIVHALKEAPKPPVGIAPKDLAFSGKSPLWERLKKKKAKRAANIKRIKADATPVPYVDMAKKYFTKKGPTRSQVRSHTKNRPSSTRLHGQTAVEGLLSADASAKRGRYMTRSGGVVTDPLKPLMRKAKK